MASRTEDLIQRFRRTESRRQQWDDWFQSLADVFWPNQAEFTSRGSRGKQRDVRNFENSHRVAARNFATTMGSFIGPQNELQLLLLPDDEDAAQRDDVRLWLDTVRGRMWRAMTRSSARRMQARGEIDMSLVILGTGAMFLGENEARNGLLYRAYHLRNVVVEANAAGEIDRIGVVRRLTAAQAAAEFGEENIGKKTREALNRAGHETREFDFVQLVLPREDRDASKLGNTNMPFASVVLDVDSEHVVRESGFQEFPFIVPRWETTPDEVYGRSPAMLAYADAKTLQAIAKTLLKGGQRAVDPPTWVLNDGVYSAVRMYPGGITVFDAQTARDMRGPPAGVFEMGTNVPLGREMQMDYREIVASAFFRDLFIQSIDRHNVSATEILERMAEKAQVLGPTLGRLEEDYVGKEVGRVFNMMERSGSFPERPEALQGSNITFFYHSPFQVARSASEAVGLARALEFTLPIAQIKPEVMDNFDEDAIVRATPELFGFKEKYIRARDEVEARRSERAQQMAAQQAAELAEKGGGAIKDMAQANKALAESENG